MHNEILYQERLSRWVMAGCMVLMLAPGLLCLALWGLVELGT